jgi:hypothetical protein
MRSLLLLDKNDLHCCLKMMEESPASADHPTIATYARSKPVDDRQERTPSPLECTHSTIFAALTGGFDGETQWRPMRCFCCNDIRKYRNFFQCQRPEFAKYYNSVLVFPLRYVRNPDRNDFDIIGFLAFDSPKTNAFIGLPEIFEFRDKPNEYKNKLDAEAAFHLGALFADSLSAHLHGIYNGAEGEAHVPRRDATGIVPEVTLGASAIESARRRGEAGRGADEGRSPTLDSD